MTPERDEGVSTATDAPDDDQGDEVDTGTKAGRDAAKYRARPRETEAERDAIRDQLAAQRRAMVDWRAQNGPTVAVDPALLDAAGIDVDTLVNEETGQLDMTAVDQFVSATAERFKLARGFVPNRAQGTSGAPVSKPSLADAFRH